VGVCGAGGLKSFFLTGLFFLITEYLLKNIELAERKAELNGYYRLHAPIYDLTRWTFLFGRNKLVRVLTSNLSGKPPKTILDVGCGTGKNVIALKRAFPDAQVVGCDLSDAMLARAQAAVKHSLNPREMSKIELINASILTLKDRQFDLIVCSYMLSMTGDSLEPILHNIRRRLNPKGKLAVVDFNFSALSMFRRWMRVNHVSLDGSVLRALALCAKVERQELHQAFGIWNWFLWIGR